ncbi:DUF6894 family protein [uncultured Methylobacterium sp.]|uniref:DUF6894 family protein n=1 Tax=uncultured Methylobacterium sp. TaxID=157278 RepID=UPI0035CC3AFD
MPHYFFNIRIGSDWVADPDGTVLPDADAAWETARDTILAALRAGPDQGRLMAASLVVTDAEGEVVLEFPFAEAVPLEPGSDGTVH